MLPPLSRYSVVDNPLKFVDIRTNEAWLGLRTPLSIPVAADDSYVRCMPGERPDQLAARIPSWKSAFGDDAAQLWWVVFDANPDVLLNPLADLDPAVTYRVPSADRVLDLLAKVGP